MPWYAGAMVPLAIANVMINDLLARARYAVVPCDGRARARRMAHAAVDAEPFPGRLEVVLQTLGAFNLLLFGVCAWFAWGRKSAPEK